MDYFFDYQVNWRINLQIQTWKMSSISCSEDGKWLHWTSVTEVQINSSLFWRRMVLYHGPSNLFGVFRYQKRVYDRTKSGPWQNPNVSLVTWIELCSTNLLFANDNFNILKELYLMKGKWFKTVVWHMPTGFGIIKAALKRVKQYLNSSS